jgi:hypothetical protein
MISVEEFVERVCLIGAAKGPRRFPRKRRDRQIMMKSILMHLDSRLSYAEPQINALLKKWKREVAPEVETDHVTIRRLLVDYGQLERRPDGAEYVVGFPPASVIFDLEVDEIDLASTVAAFRDQRERASRRGRQNVERSEPE